MPTLLVEHGDHAAGVLLEGRLLIGRAAPGGIVIPDGAVSRIHAWIDRTADGFYVADADSRSGTVVGDARLATRHRLIDGDVIRVGPASITYRAADALPEGMRRLPTAHTQDSAIAAAGGILFACSCGAPLWAPAGWVGKRGKCAHCGQRTPVPKLPPEPPSPVLHRPRPTPQPHAEAQSCSICQWRIEPNESHTRCPSCGLTFHTDCWQENKGCSAYGCAAVNSLVDPNAVSQHHPEPAADETDAAPDAAPLLQETPEPFPIEFALLGGSVLASLIGLVAFGVPALLLAGYALMLTLKRRREGRPLRSAIVAGAIAIALLGCAAGIWLSSYKWLHAPPIYRAINR